MKTNFLFLLLLAIVSSCASHQKVSKLDSGEVAVKEVEALPQKSSEVELTEVDKDLDLIQVKKFSGFTRQEQGRFWQYAKKVDEVTASQCFADYISNRNELINNKDQTRAELLEELKAKKPLLNFVMYYKNNGTVGYTYANSDTIWFNRKFHRNYSICQSAANLGHERAHKLGYTHDFNRTRRRSDQTPYVIGEAINACCTNPEYKIPSKDDVEMVKVCYRSWKTLWFKKYCYWKAK